MLSRKVRRFLRRFSEVLVGHLEVMLSGNLRAVAKPRCYHVDGKLLGQFCFARASQVLKELWPGHQARPADDRVKLGPKIGVRTAVACDNVLGSLLGLVEDIL